MPQMLRIIVVISPFFFLLDVRVFTTSVILRVAAVLEKANYGLRRSASFRRSVLKERQCRYIAVPLGSAKV
jgi:hypothetical protein